MKLKGKIKPSIPLWIALGLGLLISLLVFRLVSFSAKVTDYYTPAVLVSEDFVEAAEHLRDSLGQKEPAASTSMVRIHFRSSFQKFRKFMALFHRDGLHFNAQVIEVGDEVLALLAAHNFNPLPNRLDKLTEVASQNLRQHQEEIRRAKLNIQFSAYLVALLSLLLLGAGFYYTKLELRLQEIREQEAATLSAIKALVNALEARDAYTKGHSARVARYALQLGKALNCCSCDLDALELAAIMHDIGKIGVPDQALLKAGKLTEEEYGLIKKHPRIGETILADSAHLEKIIPGVLLHHERFDGTGYPQGISGDRIPLMAQIISVADAYDAMTSTRPYRQALSPKQAMEELKRGINTQWEQKIIECFIQTLQNPDSTSQLEFFLQPTPGNPPTSVPKSGARSN